MPNFEDNMKREFGVLFLIVALAACGRDSVEPADEQQPGIVAGSVTGASVVTGIRVTNGKSVPISLVVANRGWLGLLASCVDNGSHCITLAPGASTTVPLAEIYGAEAGSFSEAAVYYWSIINGKAVEPSGQLFVAM
jgi:hypothetical protein